MPNNHDGWLFEFDPRSSIKLFAIGLPKGLGLLDGLMASRLAIGRTTTPEPLMTMMSETFLRTWVVVSIHDEFDREYLARFVVTAVVLCSRRIRTLCFVQWAEGSWCE